MNNLSVSFERNICLHTVITFKTFKRPTNMYWLHMLLQMAFLSCLVVTQFTWICNPHVDWIFMCSKVTQISKLLSALLTCGLNSKMHWIIMTSQITFLSSLVVTMCTLIFLWTDLLCVVRELLLVNWCPHSWHVIFIWYFIPKCIDLLWLLSLSFRLNSFTHSWHVNFTWMWTVCLCLKIPLLLNVLKS